MALDIRLTQRLSQQLVMTPQLRQAIKILQVSRAELESLIDHELTENPVLEEKENAEEREEKEEAGPQETATPEDPFDPMVGDANAESTKDEATDLREIDWKDYLESYGNDMQGSISGSARDEDEDRRSMIENIPVKRQSLADHLLWQLRMADVPQEEEYVGALIIGNLDGDGYLRQSIEEVAFLANADRDVADRALATIQELDPAGVAARTLSECLLIQLRRLCVEDSLAACIVRDYLPLLESRRFDRLAKELGISPEAVADAAKIISVLEPKPARDYGDGDVRYVTPDVYVHKMGEEYVVTLNEEGLPRLRVSGFYRRMLGTDTSPEARGYIQEKMRAATWLIKSIHQRQRTLYMVTSSIVKFQTEFLNRGVSCLRPLVLKDVAQDIGMHESTVSRATAGKYVHTPQGTFELKYFFTSSLRAGCGEDVSAESVRDRIKTIIGGEDPRKPLSDQYIAQVLARENVDIARRTVAKYRELLGILPSSKRKQMY
jgi:RNA polymerase sigma-54 factor